MPMKVTPSLMFFGQAEQAINFYVSLFEGSEILSMMRYQPDEPEKEGSVKRATFRIAGQDFIAIDSSLKHDFTFTPSFSIFVECRDEMELGRTFLELSKDGNILMPLGNYGFSSQFGWLNDRFGVSWQLNLK